jgi:hypothetical protein
VIWPGGEFGLRRRASGTHTSVAGDFQQLENLLVVEMLQGIDVLDKVRIELHLTGDTRRRRRAFGYGAKGGAL